MTKCMKTVWKRKYEKGVPAVMRGRWENGGAGSFVWSDTKLVNAAVKLGRLCSESSKLNQSCSVTGVTRKGAGPPTSGTAESQSRALFSSYTFRCFFDFCQAESRESLEPGTALQLQRYHTPPPSWGGPRWGAEEHRVLLKVCATGVL